MSLFRSNDIEQILKDIAYLKKKVCCCEGDVGITTLNPPVDAPGNGDPTILFNSTLGVWFYWDGDSWEIYAGNLDQFGITIDGQGLELTTGVKGRIVVPYSGTITGWTILEISNTPVTSSIVVDVKKGTYADYDTTPTFVSIAGTEKPTIANDVKGQDLTLSTWTPTVSVGDIFEFTVDSVTDAEKVLVLVHMTKN